MLDHLGHLLPPPHWGAIGVGEADVRSMGPQLLHGFRIALEELTLRQVIVLNGIVKIGRTHACHLHQERVSAGLQRPGRGRLLPAICDSMP